MIQAKPKFIKLLSISILLFNTGCLSITSLFNNKRVIGNARTRNMISTAALYVDTLSGIPAAIWVVSQAHVKEGADTGGVVGAVMVVASLPLVVLDYIIAQGIHYLIYGEDYKVDLFKYKSNKKPSRE